MEMPYDWDLIERLLHEVQNSADDSFKPRKYAEEHATALAADGEPVGNLDHLKAIAGEYEALLLSRGFIQPRPEEEGGNGENFVLSPRGASLLAMISNTSPGSEHPRQVLDDQPDALDPATFEEVAAKAQIA